MYIQLVGFKGIHICMHLSVPLCATKTVAAKNRKETDYLSITSISTRLYKKGESIPYLFVGIFSVYVYKT